MNKEELFQELLTKISKGEISRDEVFSRLNLIAPVSSKVNDGTTKRFFHFFTRNMLYFLGAAVVITGIIIFIAQIWDDINSFSRILLTLGFGLLFAAIGSILLKKEPESNIGTIFHFIGGFLIPEGVVLTLNELHFDVSVSKWLFVISFGVLFIFYLLLNLVHKNVILTLFTIVNGTIFIYSFVEVMLNIEYYLNGDLFAYLTMVVGLIYLFLAQTFRGGWNKKLVDALYLFGSCGFLGAAFSRISDSILWQLFYFLLLVVGLSFSIYMKIRIIFGMSTLFLIVYISYITSKYFADSLGWPILIIILGFLFIGIGFVSFKVSKNYIKEVN